MKTRQYLIIRYGSNAANQSMCNRAPVGTVEASSQGEAVAKMVGVVTVYNNQYLEAVPASKARVSDWDGAAYADWMRNS
jgi:hypothetical protein